MICSDIPTKWFAQECDSGYDSKSSDTPLWTQSHVTEEPDNRNLLDMCSAEFANSAVLRATAPLSTNASVAIGAMTEHPMFTQSQSTSGSLQTRVMHPYGSTMPNGVSSMITQRQPMVSTTCADTSGKIPANNAVRDLCSYGTAKRKMRHPPANAITTQELSGLLTANTKGREGKRAIMLGPSIGQRDSTNKGDINQVHATCQTNTRKKSRSESAITREKNRKQDANVRCCISLYGCQEKGRNDKVRQFTLGSPCNNCSVCTQYDDKKIEEKRLKLLLLHNGSTQHRRE